MPQDLILFTYPPIISPGVCSKQQITWLQAPLQSNTTLPNYVGNFPSHVVIPTLCFPNNKKIKFERECRQALHILREASSTIAATSLPHGQTAQDTDGEEPESTAQTSQSKVFT